MKEQGSAIKIAAVSEDGVTISRHFGRAPFYVVVTVKDGQIVSREKREKLGQAHFRDETPAEETHHQDPRGHGFGQDAHQRHQRMVAAVQDCDVLLARHGRRGV